MEITTFRHVISNKYIKGIINLFLHTECSKFHCRFKCDQVDYINWLVMKNMHNTLDRKLSNEDYVPLSPITDQSLCKLASDHNTHPLLYKVITHPGTKSNAIVSNTVFSLVVKSDKESTPEELSPFIKQLVTLYPSLVLDLKVYIEMIILNRLDVLQLLFNHYKHLKDNKNNNNGQSNDNNNNNNQKFSLGSNITLLACRYGNLKILQLLNSADELYGIKVYFNRLSVDNAASNGHIDCLKWLMDCKKELGCTPAAINQAALHGHLDVIKLLVKNGYYHTECLTNALYNSLSKSRMDIFQYLLETSLIDKQEVANDHQLVKIACKIISKENIEKVININNNNGDNNSNNSNSNNNNNENSLTTWSPLSIVQYLIEKLNCKIDPDCCIEAAKFGNVDIIEYLFDPNNKFITKEQRKEFHNNIPKMVYDANNNIQVLEYISSVKMMNSKFPSFDNVFRNATSRQSLNLETLTWILNKFKPTKSMFTSSVKAGYGNVNLFRKVENLQLFKDQGLLSKKLVTSISTELASGSLDTLKQLEKFGIKIKYNDVMQNVITHKHNYEIMVYLHQQHNITLSKMDLEYAINCSTSEQLLYILKNMPELEYPANTIQRVVEKGNLKLLYALVKKKFAKSPEVMEATQSAANQILYSCTGRLDVIQLLYDHYFSPDIFQSPALDIVKPLVSSQQYQFNYTDGISFFMQHFPEPNTFALEEALLYRYGGLDSWQTVLYLYDKLILIYASLTREQTNIMGKRRATHEDYIFKLLECCLQLNDVGYLHYTLFKFQNKITSNMFDRLVGATNQENQNGPMLNNYLKCFSNIFTLY